MDPLSIRPARDADARACRLLLPAMFRADRSPDVLVAWSGKALAGAIGLGTVPLPDGGGVVCHLQVVPPRRRRGIGRALVEAAAARTRASALRTFLPVPEDGPEAAFSTACGFAVQRRILHFETDTAAFLDDMACRRRRLEQRARIPASAQAVPLRQAPPDQVAALIGTHFPARPGDILRRLDPAAPDRLDLDCSVALLLDGAVRAVLIYGWKDGLPVIEARVVDPALRGGWANVLILEAATRNGWQAGAARFRFYAEEGVLDTMKLASRSGADQIGAELHLWRRLA